MTKKRALFWTTKRKKKQARKNGPPQYCFAQIGLEACPEVFCSDFHGLATLELETCLSGTSIIVLYSFESL
jgi:hypothetical protein